jgi:hypothetical protein
MPATTPLAIGEVTGHRTLHPAALSTAEAGAYIGGVSPGTLMNWRSDPRGNAGPPYVKLGSGPKARVVYRVVDLDAWLAANVRDGAA